MRTRRRTRSRGLGRRHARPPRRSARRPLASSRLGPPQERSDRFGDARRVRSVANPKRGRGVREQALEAFGVLRARRLEVEGGEPPDRVVLPELRFESAPELVFVLDRLRLDRALPRLVELGEENRLERRPLFGPFLPRALRERRVVELELAVGPAGEV